eukprot:gene16450-22433_t
MEANSKLDISDTPVSKKLKTVDEKCLDVNMSENLSSSIYCHQCLKNFISRNQLFKHIKLCNVLRSRIRPILANEETQDFIYVTGGRLRGKTLGYVERYSVVTGSWQICSNMLENRGSHGSGSVGNVLYVVGGGGFRSNLSSNEKLDCITNSWQLVMPMPTSRHALQVVTAEHFIYAIGGWIDGSICSPDVEKYDTVGNIWIICTPMQIGRRLFGSTRLKNEIFVFGGNIKDKEWYTDTVEVYDIENNSWKFMASLPKGGQCSAVTVHDSIYIFIHGDGVYLFTPIDGLYLRLNDLPISSWFCFDVCTTVSRVFVSGGASAGKWLKCLYEYDLYENIWKELPSMSRERRRCSATVVTLPLSGTN